MKDQSFGNPRSEVRMKVRQKDIIRKKYSKNNDMMGATVNNKRLADIPFNKENVLLDFGKINSIFNVVDMKVAVKDLDIYQRAFVHASYTVGVNCDENIDQSSVSGDSAVVAAKPLLMEEGYITKDFSGTILPLQPISSERLEFLGDSVCGMCVADYLYTRFPDEDEGFMTRLRTRLVCGSRLGEFAEKLGLQTHVIISRYVETVSNGRKNYKVLEDIFEAFVGALYLDNDHDTSICYKFIIAVIEKYIDFADLIANDSNMKDQLLR